MAHFHWYGTARDGTGRHGTAWDGTGRHGTARDGTGRDGTGRGGSGVFPLQLSTIWYLLNVGGVVITRLRETAVT